MPVQSRGILPPSPGFSLLGCEKPTSPIEGEVGARTPDAAAKGDVCIP